METNMVKNSGTQERVSETQRVKPTKAPSAVDGLKKQNDDCPAALTVNARQAAKMLNVSVRQVWRLCNTGKLPKPIRLGHCVRWRKAELEAFVAAGCPCRQDWENRSHDSN